MDVDKIISLLLVEDEALVLLATQDTLESGGYSVITASSGEEALEILKRGTREIAAVITDVRLGPGPDGWELARRARELEPGLAVIYTTGDGAAEWPALGVSGSVLIAKPYGPPQVLAAVRALLPRAGGSLAA